MEESNNQNFKRKDLVHPELCYKIVGALFEVYRQAGGGYKEKYYQNMVAIELNKVGLKYKKELFIPLVYKEEKIGSYFLDFLVEDKIVLELKTKDSFSKKDIEQVYSYLKEHKLELGILANFTKSGVRFKRIVNLK